MYLIKPKIATTEAYHPENSITIYNVTTRKKARINSRKITTRLAHKTHIPGWLTGGVGCSGTAAFPRGPTG